MNLRAKLLMAQLPLVLALLASIIVGGLVTTRLARSSQRILKDNYRSVLAIQRMSDAAASLNSASLFVAAGRRAEGIQAAAGPRRQFEEELRVQEGNISEQGEREATSRLRGFWQDYQERFDRFVALPDGDGLRDRYFSDLLSGYRGVRDASAVILAMNQDAMVRKSDQAKRDAERFGGLLVAVTIGGLLLGLAASTALTARLLRPLSVLSQAARRISEGDLAARAQVLGRDEIAGLAGDFNAMVERLQKYRESSLGELLQAQLAAQAAIDSLDDPVLVLGAAGDRPLQINRAAESTLRAGVDRPVAMLDPAVRAAVERAHHHVVGGRGPFVPRGLDEAVRFATPDGERWLLPRASPVYAEEGDVAGTTIVLQDVTRLVRFEELRNNFVATAGHELKTPLTSLRMAIHLLTEKVVGPLNEKQEEMVHAAREDAERLQKMVDELLDLSRIQSGRIELRLRATDPGSLVKGALETQRGAALPRRVALRAEIAPGMGAVNVDPERIQLVFSNLLSNAIRYSPEGGTVRVSAAAEKDGGARFEVSDQGPGIPAEYHQAIFDKYFQLPGSSTSGAGLGLFIASEIVQAHGGAIGVADAPEGGSRFWFTVPEAPSHGASSA